MPGVAREHGQVVEVDGRAPVGFSYLLIVDLSEPVVSGDGAGVGEDQVAHRVGDGGVLLHPPVGDLQIVVHQVLVVEEGGVHVRGVHVPDLLPLLAVQDVGLGHVRIAAFRQHLFHAVLDVLHGDAAVLDLVLEVRRHMEGQQVDHAGMIGLVQGHEGLGDGAGDLADGEFGDLSVTLFDLVHRCFSCCKFQNLMGRSPIQPQHPSMATLPYLVVRCQYLVLFVNKSHNILYLYGAVYRGDLQKSLIISREWMYRVRIPLP